MNVQPQPSPGVYPRSTLPPPVQPSERKVHEALASALPAGWSAWHSLKIRIKAGDFSDADFVIADPARGILVFEVKEGIVRKQDGVWFQNERPMKMPPLDQAHRFVRVLLGKYKERDLVPPVIGVAAVFPDTEFEGQPTQGDLEGLVLGARELPYMEELQPGLLERALPAGMRRRPSPEWTAFLHVLWCESWPAAMNFLARSGVGRALEGLRLRHGDRRRGSGLRQARVGDREARGQVRPGTAVQVHARDPGAGGCLCGRENGGGRRKSERAEGKGWKRGRWGRGGNGSRT